MLLGAGAALADLDADGIPDASDNCTLAANASQCDSDFDGYGNACDGDYDNDLAVGLPDFNAFRSAFGQAVPPGDPDIDANCDGAIGLPDFNAFRDVFGGPPGPSGLACAGSFPCSSQGTPAPDPSAGGQLVCAPGHTHYSWNYPLFEDPGSGTTYQVPPNDAVEDADFGLKVPLEICIELSYTQTSHAELGGPPPELPTPFPPDCVPPSYVNCPVPIGFDPPPSTTSSTPPDPVFPSPSRTKPGASCPDGSGWDFETATDSDPFDGWKDLGAGSGVEWPAFAWGPIGGDPDYDGSNGDAPPAKVVFGNNVEVERIQPPGFAFVNGKVPELDLGGDYWRFARGIGYQGNWWVGSGDFRPRHTLQPGARIPETATGVLASPPCLLDADYLSFLVGGTSSNRQYVAMAVRKNDPLEVLPYQGIFQNGVGGAENPPQAPGPSDLPVTLGLDPNDWFIVFKSGVTDPLEAEHMARRAVWDVSQFRGRDIQVLIVDDRHTTDCSQQYPGCPGSEVAHINADDFHFSDTPPPETFWHLVLDHGLLVPSTVGSVSIPAPLWGFADAHTHPASNLSFGEHVIWGDVQDSLEDVYNCQEPLPEILDNQSNKVRPETPSVAGGAMIETTCSVNIDLIAAVTVAALAACLPLAGIPFAGPALVATCQASIIDASIQLAQQPVVTGWTMHGAKVLSSGSIELGLWLDSLIDAFSVELGIGLSGAIPTMDWDSETSLGEKDHFGLGLGLTHQKYQYQMIQRAYLGGMRVLVADVNNSQTLELAFEGQAVEDDWQALVAGTETIRRLVAQPGDPVYPPGVLSDIAEIALTPDQARVLVAEGKLAIILGAEVPGLGFRRSVSDSVESQVTDLWNLGIRKVTPVHGVNNPLGGTAYFDDNYNTANYYEGFGSSGAQWKNWSPFGVEVGMALTLASSFVPPFGGLLLQGGWEPGEQWVGGSWFGVDPTNPTTLSLPFVGTFSDITWRFGFGSAPRQLLDYRNGAWKNLDDIDGEDVLPLIPTRFRPLDWLIGGATAAHPCSLDDTFIPAKADIDEWQSAGINANYAGSDGHFNPAGLDPNAGEDFVRAAMRRGMLIGMDHFSQRARSDVLQLAETFADEAFGGGASDDDYPVYGEHTHLRDWDMGGPVADELRGALGAASEAQRTATELSHVGDEGGMVAPIVRSTGVVPTSQAPLGGAQVRNDCDYSSKSWAVTYLEMSRLMKGRGVAASTDYNPTPAPNSSRFGWANPHGRACHALPHFESIQANPQLAAWPRDFATGSCDDNTLASSATPWSASCPSTQMVTAQLGEWSGVVYDEYALKTQQPQGGNADLISVLARGSLEVREDSAPRAPIDEWVNVYDAGTDTRRMYQQMYPLKQFDNFDGDPVGVNKVKRGWDYNLDGMDHVGLYPDFFQDVRNVGVTFEQLGPLFNSSEDLIDSWQRACDTGNAWSAANSMAPLCQ